MNVTDLTDQQLNSTLKNFYGKVANYADTLTLTPEEIAEVKADSQAFDYVIDMQNQIQHHSKDWTAFKKRLRSDKKAVATGDFPIWSPATPPAVSLADINTRFSKLIQRIKNHKNFTEAIGHDLGIMSIGEPMTLAEKAVLKPVLNVHLVAGQPVVEWKKGSADGIEIHKKTSVDGEYQFLEIDLHPHFPDKSALPAPGKSEVWKYKAIYRMDDERVGSWSDEVSVSVMG